MRIPDSHFLHRLADAADKETMARFRTQLVSEIKPKEGFTFDPVTEADREAERVMREIIALQYPEHSILGEEYGLSGDGSIRWVLDPIDGTRPYLCGIPVWGTLIGLTVEDRAVLGMMSQPVTRERFWADESGSWVETSESKRRLESSAKANLAESILHINAPEQIGRHRQYQFYALDACVRMTRYGGECYAFAMLAAGQIDLCLEFSLQPYDIVALVPIIERAGGMVTTLEGRRPEQGGPILASANAVLHEAALRLLNG